ncbi:MAG: hypothetical protein JNK69_00690 [Saprospiraceae bacterium]|nr:hypothetical protein [Candidatus Vicinibacter proximus]MBL7821895.1 hypothetical protein [Saprospiraceae bacterium]MCC6842602.1 hypothetical protein [Saprospiraceae bacterium]
MYQIITGTILVSILHALIPSHWIPLISVSKTSNWTKNETLKITFFVGLCHVLSSILLGVLIGFIGFKLNVEFKAIFKLAGPILLIIMGIFFVYRHHTHHHFQLDGDLMEPPIRKKQLILSLMMFMLLSPCIEIEAFFFAAGSYGIYPLLMVALIYALFTLAGMLIWVDISWRGMQKFNFHKMEHGAGLVTGSIIIITGIVSFFLN